MRRGQFRISTPFSIQAIRGTDDNLNMAKLLAGRIDLWITGLYKGTDSPAPINNKAIKPVMIVRDVDYYLAAI